LRAATGQTAERCRPLTAISDRPRLLALGWHAPGTGFDRVLHAILSRLSTQWEVHLAGIGYQGPAFERDGYRVHQTNPRGGDAMGAYAARELGASLSPDVLLVLHDVWHMARYERLLRPFAAGTRRVVYLPLDGAIVDPRLAAPLLSFDLVVAYCEWGRAEIAGAWTRLGAPPESWPRLLAIPHGLDQEAFRPLVDASVDRRARGVLRRQVFPSLAAPEDAFVALNASRPALRKRLDLTVAGFSRFARDKPSNVALCLHWAVTGEVERETVLRQAAELGVADRLLLDPLGGGPLADGDLNLLYNACDVGLNTSMGEGWGLVSCEHAAAGAPQVVPRHSACAEIWEGAALFVEPVRRYVPHFSPLELAEVDADGVAAALERLYGDPELHAELAAAGRRRALTPEWSWGAVAAQWRQELSSLGRRVS
jgi:D-inositol-3-phosphate glycosyltransferase